MIATINNKEERIKSTNPSEYSEGFEKWINSSSFKSELGALRSSAEADGIQQSYVIQPEKDEKFIAANAELEEEINAIQNLLLLPDYDFENNADKAGLTSEQYRTFLHMRLRNLEIQSKLLNEPTLNSNDVLLAYDLYRSHQGETNRNEFHAIIEKEKRKVNILETALIFLSMACLVLFCLFNNELDKKYEPHELTAPDSSYAEPSPQKFFVTSSGTKYHIEGCNSISGKTDLKAFDSEREARRAGYEPCKLCIGEESD